VLYDGKRLQFVVYPKCGRRPACCSWIYGFESPVTKKRTTMVLGNYPAMGLAEARRARDVQDKVLDRGLDPKLERKRAKTMSGLTFEQTARAWDVTRAGVVADRTRETAMQRLELHVLPRLGARLLPTITASDVRDVCDRIVKADHAETAHRTHTIINQIFDWAQSRDMLENNPSRRLKGAYPSPEAKNIAAIVRPEPFGHLLRAIDDYSGHLVTRAALRLAPHVFLRPAELRGATWDEFDFDTATWVIPAKRMKRKKNGDHLVPLSKQALSILLELKEATFRKPTSYVFPGTRAGKALSDNTLNAALTTLGYSGEVHRTHGFRASASTMLNEMALRSDCLGKFNYEHIEVQLAHKQKNESRDPYMRANFIEQRRAMMQIWSDECDRMRELASKVAA